MKLQFLVMMILFSMSQGLFGQLYLEKGLSSNLEGRRSPSEEAFDDDDIREEMRRQHEEDCENECDD
jgi:hypothetical protein